MKTRVIQDEPDERPAPHPWAAPAAGEKPPPDLTGRRRRWSARYWRIALWVMLAALVLGAAYLVTRPGSDAPAANGPGAAPKFAAIERFVWDEMAARRIRRACPRHRQRQPNRLHARAYVVLRKARRSEDTA